MEEIFHSQIGMAFIRLAALFYYLFYFDSINDVSYVTLAIDMIYECGLALLASLVNSTVQLACFFESVYYSRYPSIVFASFYNLAS